MNRSPARRYLWPGLAGLVFGLAALAVSRLLLGSTPESWQIMPYTATIAAAFTGALVWAAWQAGGRRLTWLKGAGLGALVGLLSHPLAWYLAILYYYVSGAESSLGERTLDPLQGLWAALLFSLLSLALTGWLTALAGAFLGGALAYVQVIVDRRQNYANPQP